MMKRNAEEAEVVARLDYATGETHITVVSWPAMARRMERLYGKPTRDGLQVKYWKLPTLLVTFRRPPTAPRMGNVANLRRAQGHS
jgi:hypothetical protein